MKTDWAPIQEALREAELRGMRRMQEAATRKVEDYLTNVDTPIARPSIVSDDEYKSDKWVKQSINAILGCVQDGLRDIDPEVLAEKDSI